MDSNAHSNLWGSPTTNKRGEILENITLHHGLNILNKGSTPTFHSPVGKSVIDVTLSSADMLEYMTNWEVMGESSLSDH